MYSKRFLTHQNNMSNLSAIIAAVQKESMSGGVVLPQNGIDPTRWSGLKKAVAKLGPAESEKQFLNGGE